MAVTVGGTSITFNDGTTQSTAATVPTTANVLAATAGASAGAVGTYAFLMQGSLTNTNFIAGTTYAGSGLRYAGLTGIDNDTAPTNYGQRGATPSGTWRAMGSSHITGTSYLRATLLLRIS